MSDSFTLYLRSLMKEGANALAANLIRDHFALYRRTAQAAPRQDQEGTFRTSDGRLLPVYRGYRHSIKKGFSVIPELAILLIMQRKGWLTSEESFFCRSCFGSRTLTCSVEDIASCLKIVAARYKEQFIPESLAAAVPIIRPDKNQAESLVKEFIFRHRELFHILRSYQACDIRKGMNVLEIGFESGGHSLFAFERMGLQAFGIDNCYDGIVERPLLADAVKGLLQAHAELRVGDITKTNTCFVDGFFDLVYSSSVIEHIKDLKAAFLEMRRVVRDGGYLVHNYNPFFCPNGGHASGILDSPWAHVCLSQEDYLRYIEELRPFEYERSREWILHGLNPDSTMANVQKEALSVGFEIVYWRETPAPSVQLADLTPEIAADCLRMHLGIGLADLVTQNVTFVARKI